jgi:xylulokinase
VSLVAGVDSSTQSCKVVLCDAETGEPVGTATAAHPDGTEVHPAAWAAALEHAGEGLLERAAAVAVAGQQHGMVVLDNGAEVLRPALLWNDTRSADAADELVAELGGPDVWARAVGSVPVASYTVTKLRWLARHEPELASRVERVLLPHDWLTWQLTGHAVEPCTDPGDASGTGYWSPAERRYREDLLRLALGHDAALPRVARARDVVGETPTGAALAAGTGDNMAAALGVGAGEHDVVVSIGTSGTAFAVSPRPTHDPTGAVSGFADATGRYLPLVCTLNAARVLTATAAMLDTDLAGLDRLALGAAPGAEGLVLLPYLDGERTPNLPGATGSLRGLTRANMTPGNVARAAVEGMLCALAAALDALTREGVEARRVILVGGGARSRAVRALAPGLFDLPVVVPEPDEYVARGAARLAAWALAGTEEPPPWPVAQGATLEPDGVGAAVRARFAEEANHLLSPQTG